MSVKLFAVMMLVAFSMVLSCKHEPLVAAVDNSLPTQSIVCSTDTVYFGQSVLPLFVSNCAQSGCHDPASHEGGVVLDNYDNIIRTGKIKAFDPGGSKAYKKIIEPNANDRMPPPPMPAFTTDQKAAVYKWIMQGAKNNSCSGRCDSAVFTFSGAIRPLLNAQCAGCHSGSSAQGGIDLSTYAAVKGRVNDGKLWGSVNHLPGFSAMPKNGAKLPDCQIGQLQKWMAAGAPNN